MQKRKNLFPYFILFLILCLLVFGISRISFFKPINSFIQAVLSPFQAIVYGTFANISASSESSDLKTLKEENANLIKELVDQNKNNEDIKALKDQFQTQNPRSSLLSEANVIGAPSFIPSVSVPEILILDRGENDGVRVGNAVIYKDNLVGKVIKTSKYISAVMLVTNSSFSFTAKTLSTNGLGVVKGQGRGGIILDNVLLSDSLKKDDLVLTKGDINQNGEGLPPDLVVGKITSISKNPSDLFQKADVQSSLDFTNLSKVFIITGFNR